MYKPQQQSLSHTPYQHLKLPTNNLSTNNATTTATKATTTTSTRTTSTAVITTTKGEYKIVMGHIVGHIGLF